MPGGTEAPKVRVTTRASCPTGGTGPAPGAPAAIRTLKLGIETMASHALKVSIHFIWRKL